MFQHKNFDYEERSEDSLSCVIWSFCLVRSTLVVDTYTEFSRPSTRHKLKANPARSYRRLNSRDSIMKLKDLPDLSEEFKAKIVEAFIAEVKSALTVSLTVT